MTIRPLCPEDEPLVVNLHKTLSEESGINFVIAGMLMLGVFAVEALNTAIEEIIGLQYTLKMLRVPIDGACKVFADWEPFRP